MYSDKIECPVCKAKENKKIIEATSIYTNNFYTLGRCEDCSHIFILDPSADDELNNIYKTIYGYQAHLAIEDEKKWRIRKLKKVINRFIPLDAWILDIGCGYGSNMEMLRESDYTKLTGVEINPLAVDRCKEKGLDVYEGTFTQWLNSGKNRSKNSVCILLSHVLEHIQDLDNFFADVNAFLKSGDRLIVMSPNAEAVTARLFGGYWGWWSLPAHPHHFSPKSINQLLSLNGFVVDLLFTRGADSLFFLSTLLSLFGIKSKSQIISPIQRIIIKLNSAVLRYWLFMGNEELVVIAKKI